MAELNRQDIISDDALMAPLVLSKNFEQLMGTINMVIAKGKEHSQTIGAATSTIKLAKETEALTKEQRELLKVQNQIAAAVAKDNNAYRAQEKELQKLKKALKDKSVLGDRDAKTINKTNASIVQLGAALNKNRVAYSALTTEEQRNSKEGKELLKIIQQQDIGYKELRAAMGQHQDQVGNYEGAMRKLRAELKAAKDELVGIAEQFGEDSEQFREAALKAGELSDKIGDLSESIKSVSGEPLERMAGSMDLIVGKLKALDFKGAEVGVRQFTKASREMTFKQAIQGMGGFTKSIVAMGRAIITNPLFIMAGVIVGVVLALRYFQSESAKASQMIIDNAKKEMDAITERYDHEIRLASIAGKQTFQLEREKQKALIKTAEVGIKASGDLTDVDILQSIIQRRLVLTVNEEKKQALDDFVKAKKEAEKEIEAIDLQEAENQKRLAKEKQLREEGDLFKLRQFRLQNAIETQNAIAENENLSEEKRLEANTKAVDLRKQLAWLEYQNALKAEGLTADGRRLLYEQYQAEIKSIDIKSAKDREAIDKEITEKQRAEHEKRIANARDAAMKMVTEKQNEVDAIVALIQQQVIRGEKTVKEGEKEIAQVRKDMADDVIKAQIDGLNNLINSLNLSKEEFASVQQELFTLQNQLTNALYENLNQNQNTALENTTETLQKIYDIYSNFSAAIGELLSSLADRRIQDLEIQQEKEDENRQALIEKEKEKEATLLENENLTAEQRDAIKERSAQKQAQIEAASAKRQEEFEKKKIKEQQRVARFEKAAALIAAGISTALAVIRALSAPPGVPYTIPAGILAGALGAIQIAAIAAKPIPQFEDGGITSSKTIIAGEAGSELYKTPSGQFGLTPSTATVMNLPVGTEIFPHEETVRMLALSGLMDMRRNDRSERQNNYDMGKLETEIKSMHRTLKNKKEFTVNGHISGYTSNGTRVKYIESLRNRP